MSDLLALPRKQRLFLLCYHQLPFRHYGWICATSGVWHKSATSRSRQTVCRWGTVNMLSHKKTRHYIKAAFQRHLNGLFTRRPRMSRAVSAIERQQGGGGWLPNAKADTQV
jgi:uncharacterized protein YbgA (DUF1722 family)